MGQVTESLAILCVYVVELGAVVILAGVIWWIGDLWISHVARQQRRMERRARNSKLAA